jgi:hypothetical protein
MSAEHPTTTVRRRQRPTSSFLLDASAVMVTLGAAAVCWLIALPRMRGMDVGVETTLGSFSFFVVAWVSIISAMMLPGALPAVLRKRVSASVWRGPAQIFCVCQAEVVTDDSRMASYARIASGCG